MEVGHVSFRREMAAVAYGLPKARGEVLWLGDTGSTWNRTMKNLR